MITYVILTKHTRINIRHLAADQHLVIMNTRLKKYQVKLQIVDFGIALPYGQVDTYVYTNKDSGRDVNKPQYIDIQT